MTNEALHELAARVEAAEGADTELDARIWCALNGKRYRDHWQSDYHKGTQVEFTEPPKRTAIVTKRPIPNVTASLDAALTLADDDTAADAMREAFSYIQVVGWREGDFKGALARATVAAILRALATKDPTP